MTSLADSVTGQFGFGYDALSRRTSLTRPNGVNTAYSYDSLSRLLSVLHQAGTSTIDGAAYTYDNAGNRLSKLNYLNNVTENYTYDPLYQLTQVQQGLTTTESYSYDPVGNRLSSLGMSPYTYNSSNQLLSTPQATYTYDANGNTLTKADSSGTTTYGWDFENRLTSVMSPGTTATVAFNYDSLGHRIRKTSSSGSVIYLYDGDNLILQLDASGATLNHYSSSERIDEELASISNSGVEFYHQDGLMSLTTMSNAGGSLLNSYVYDSFGNVINSTTTVGNALQYTGREYDTETHLRYYRARYYDQAAGRFLSEDPFRFFGGINLYAYVRNNPSTLVDSSGLAPEQGPAVLVPSKIIKGRFKLEGNLDPLCRKGRDKVKDAAMLNQSIDTRFAEIEYYLNQKEQWLRDLAADPGHLQRLENEFEALKRCTDCDNDKPEMDPILIEFMEEGEKQEQKLRDMKPLGGPLFPVGIPAPAWAWLLKWVH